VRERERERERERGTRQLETDSRCFAVWDQTLTSSAHRFGNIGLALQSDNGASSVYLQNLNFDVQVAESHGLHLSPIIRCGSHGGLCQQALNIDISSAGTPCQDWSSLNRGAMRQFGPRGWILICWIRLEARKGTRILIHENVAQLELWLIFLLVGDAYWVRSRVVKTAQAAQSQISRTRRYTVMYLKRSCVVIYDVWRLFDQVCVTLQARIDSRVENFFIASFEEIRLEIAQLCRDRGVRIGCVLDFANRTVRNFSLLLSPDERRRLSQFRYLWRARFNTDSRSAPWAIFNLGHNLSHLTWSGVSHAIPCLNTKVTRVWADFIQRFLTTRELLAAMGLCPYPWDAWSAGVAPFEMGGVPQIDARHMLGNSMQIGTLGTIIACAMASARPRAQTRPSAAPHPGPVPKRRRVA
jgi:hypothetical protein